ncbi:MAG TPA: hypothetical protein VFA20_13360 [Myxococcaceae bacterium]|nr:hypothetical protein [Myxococcaceae bacterium]
MRRVILAAAITLAVVVAGVLLSSRGSRSSTSGVETAAPSPPRASSRPGGAIPGAGAGVDRDALVAQLRSRYGARIQHPYVQLKMLERLIPYFRAQSPDHWRESLLDLLRAAFPDHFAELAANLQHWLDYERWMDEQRTSLQGMDDEKRRAAIREARERIFGKEAAANIWASELKNQAAADALHAADALQGATVSDRLERYKEGLEDVYQEQTESYLERHRQEALDRFLDLDSVQKDLSALGQEDRERSLREIRQGLGLSEEALQRWDVLDRERDARWDAGARYMQEREALAKQYVGDGLEQRLRELRTRYFGAEAETIAAEEQGGFFRFSRSRRWGRN